MNPISSFIQYYKDNFVIPHADSAELAEKTRFNLIICTSILFILGLGDLLAVLIVHFSDLTHYLPRLIYYGIFTIASLGGFIYSVLVKDCPKEKAWFYKSIQVYIYICIMLGMTLYNFFIFTQSFNGFILFIFIGILCLSLFSLPPWFYFLGMTIPLCIMSPTLYDTFGLSGLADAILVTIIVFCLSLYKQAIEKKQIILVKKQKYALEVMTFGNFTLIYEGSVVKFSRSKSLELMAYLVSKNGSSVNTKELLAVLYGDEADSTRYGSSFRNLVVDIKHKLNELNILDFFIAEYNSFRINPEVIKCDYYDFLNGDKQALKSYTGEFMNQYSWGEETAGFLDMKVMK